MLLMEKIAIALWEQESIRASGKPRSVEWEDAGDSAHNIFRDFAKTAIETISQDHFVIIKNKINPSNLLERQLGVRDKFLVNHGLWEQFVDWLPREGI
jgi:hypothetical protein